MWCVFLAVLSFKFILSYTWTTNTLLLPATVWHHAVILLLPQQFRIGRVYYPIWVKMRVWCEYFFWISESRTMSIMRYVRSTIRCKPNPVGFLRTQRVFATTSGLQFLLFISVDRQRFWLMIANCCRNNNRQSPLKWQSLITAEITIVDCHRYRPSKFEGGREFTPTSSLQKKFASCPELKI